MGTDMELWFVRHGESKNNAILSAAGGLGAVAYPLKFSQDPYITEKGKQVAEENGKRLVAAEATFDLLVCSAMIRTIETSYYMFIKNGVMDKVFVVPYISELPLTFGKIPIYENIPLKRQEQIKLLGKAHGSDLLEHVDWSLVGGPNGDNQELLPPSGDNFLQWLYSQEMVKELLMAKKSSGEKVKIAVVTHSHFLMKKDTLHLDKKPSNADIWIANVHVTPSNGQGEDVLSLTDLRGWYREEIAVKQEKVGKKLEKTGQKATKKTEKYMSKLSRLSQRFKQKTKEDQGGAESEEQGEDGEEGNAAQSDSDDSEAEKAAKALEKRNKKEEKYKKRMSKKQQKYDKRMGELEERKGKYVNIADLEIEEARKRQEEAQE